MIEKYSYGFLRNFRRGFKGQSFKKFPFEIYEESEEKPKKKKKKKKK